MIFPQVLKLASFTPGDTAEDTKLVFPGESVLNDATQDELGADDGESTISVDLDFFSSTNGFTSSVVNKTMTFNSAVNIWSITVDAQIKTALPDRSKYTGKVKKNVGEVIDMREFRLPEFSVDNGSFEQMLSRLPYEIIIGSPSQMRWYESTSDFSVPGPAGTVLFHADLYEGNVGTTPATSADKVTHRGPILEGP